MKTLDDALKALDSKFYEEKRRHGYVLGSDEYGTWYIKQNEKQIESGTEEQMKKAFERY